MEVGPRKRETRTRRGKGFACCDRARLGGEVLQVQKPENPDPGREKTRSVSSPMVLNVAGTVSTFSGTVGTEPLSADFGFIGILVGRFLDVWVARLRPCVPSPPPFPPSSLVLRVGTRVSLLLRVVTLPLNRLLTGDG